MFLHSLLSILLHTRVNGGEDAQSVGIYIIMFAVALHVLITPTVERILAPGNRVDGELPLVPRGIVVALGLFCHHVLAQELLEIVGRAFHCLGSLVVESQWHLAGLVILRARDVAALEHLLQNHVAARQASLLVLQRIKQRRVLAESYEHGSLTEVEVARFLAEVGICRALYAHSVVEEIEVVEIHRYYLLLCEIAFQLNGYNPLYRLLQQTFHLAVGFLRVELFCQLLGDGRASSGTLVAHHSALHHRTSEGNEVYSRVFVETLILRSHKRVDEVRRQVVVVHSHSVGLVQVPCANHLSVGRVHL